MERRSSRLVNKWPTQLFALKAQRVRPIPHWTHQGNCVHDFTGTVHLVDEPDAVLDAKVTVDLNRVLVRAADAEIGSWPHSDIKVKKAKDGVLLIADEETLVLNLENEGFFLDLLGVEESQPPNKGRRRRKKKPVLMPEPPPAAPEGSKSKYVADESTVASFSGLRNKAAASYGDDTKLHHLLAWGLAAAIVVVLAGSALNWGSARLLEPGSFPIGRVLTGFGGLSAMIGLYFAFFDGQRVSGSAVAIAAGTVVLAIMYFYTRAAQLKLGFFLTILGSIALIVIGALGLSDLGSESKYHDEE